MRRVGLISDTHGLLRPEAEHFLRGADLIVHAGDVGGPEILHHLARIAPVTAVRGNNDHGAWADGLAQTACLTVEGVRLYVLHDMAQLAIDPQADGVQVVIAGHSHKPSVETRDGIVRVNPGSAGPCRFRLPISVGELIVQGASVSARTVVLEG